MDFGVPRGFPLNQPQKWSPPTKKRTNIIREFLVVRWKTKEPRQKPEEKPKGGPRVDLEGSCWYLLSEGTHVGVDQYSVPTDHR